MGRKCRNRRSYVRNMSFRGRLCRPWESPGGVLHHYRHPCSRRIVPGDCTPRALPRAMRSGAASLCSSQRHVLGAVQREGQDPPLQRDLRIYIGLVAVFLGKGQKSPGAGKPRAWDRYGGSFPIRQSRHTAARCGDTLDKNVRLLCFVVTGIGAATFLSEASICHGGGNIPVKIYLSMWMFRWG